MYVAFEERFRGSREEIARRLSIYLPVLEKARVRDSDSPVLDLGCGRGEWLELLGQHEYAARGVDLNEEFVLRTRQQGLSVVHAEAVDYLGAQPAGSAAAVTSFHLVEHLPVGRLFELLAQIHRILRPGGILILETPNPENHVVGSCNFHTDPTHMTPLPPALLQFLTEQAGFATTWLARVNADLWGIPLEGVPRDAPHSLQINAAIHLLNQAHYIAPDYAIIAQKDGGLVSITGSQEIKGLCDPRPADVTSFRRLEADARAHKAEATAHTAEAQMAAVYASTSWRITRPLRGLMRMALRLGGSGRSGSRGRRRHASVAPAANEAPEDLGDVPESTQEVTEEPPADAVDASMPTGAPAPQNPEDISLAAREVLRELHAARRRAASHEEG